MLTIAAYASNELGECPLWCERTRRLYWTDIEGSELLAIQEDGEEISRWPLPERLGSFALTNEEHILLMGFESCLGYYDLQSNTFTLVSSSPGAPGTRINDGRCDRAGNFVFSTMHNGYPVEPIGKFHRLNSVSLETETLDLPAVAIPNSICFSPDGGTMYYSDSMQGRIFCCDYPSLDNQRIFTEVEGGGAPDGSCIDAQGYLWNAEWGGSRVVRYSPEGETHSILSAPAIQTTCPVLGGSSLNTLFCTSARVGLTEPTTYDGALFSIRSPFFAGLPESRFGLISSRHCRRKRMRH
ncbi:SMP-30/gluconolactonase/LRE family protein [Pectobacterium brasiliense]|uniref:SMP-30/gluconolactonase/LRE family protein n=1 Tax=Pectobacterium brasiliense TaxID=180957 RepID=UPI0019698DC6|nr:SMP-30/gluconolactonase/LRE family protein [Pectobacterium brasiliense]MBN3096505.1 SMP-30/gluconolactonase/LRE family protein [Pectobacterium brasiliense]MBN3166044.1 SMP-30/gluconolactonase/LRE family protein [Pectobacterium brasiliense]